MRRLIWLVLLFVLLWSGWWFFASQSLQIALRQWFEDRRDENWQAETSDIKSAGYPFSLEKTLVAPALADPQTGVAFSTDEVVISAPAWWPGYVTVSFPSKEITLASPVDRYVIASTGARAELRLKPGSALELDELATSSGPWSLTSPEGSLVAAQGLTLSMKKIPEVAHTYTISFDAPTFQPGSVPRQALRIPADWPVAFDNLVLDASVVFDRAIDRTTIEDARPQPERIDLHLVEAAWGALLLRAAATLDVSPEGLLSGEFSLQARNWRDMLTLAQTAGALPDALRPQLESILNALAQGSGNPDTIDVTISLSDGTMFLGFIPLGPAPKLVLR